jgi:hypothetical protein
VLTLTGCFVFAPRERTPTVAGVIQSSENVDGVWVYQLEGGETVEIDFDETVTLPRSSGGGDPGTLLFHGDGNNAWYMGLAPSSDGYQFDAAARDDGTHIVFENGLRLSKAPGFDGRGWPQDGRYDSPASECCFAPFCINAQGQVTAYLAQPSDRREGCPEG